MIAFLNAHVVPIEGEPYDGSVLVTDGKISALKGKAPKGATLMTISSPAATRLSNCDNVVLASCTPTITTRPSRLSRPT